MSGAGAPPGGGGAAAGTLELPRRVLVVDRSTRLYAQLRDALDDTGRDVDLVHLPQSTQLLETVRRGDWDAVVAGPSQETPSGLRRLAAVRAEFGALGLVVAVNGHEPPDLTSFVHARPDDLVRVPAGGAELASVVLATLEKVAIRRARIAQEARRVAPPPKPRTASVYLVAGPSGGSGKTMIATNLAWLLAHRGGGRVVLVDLDVQFGEVTAMWQLRPAHTMHDVLFDEQERRLDDDALAESLGDCLTDGPGGVKVLPAPRNPVHADAIGPDDVDRILRALATQAEYVVVDAPAGLRELTLAAQDHADHTLIVSQVDVPGVHNLHAFLETLDRLGVAPEKRSVVLNKDLPDAGVSAADVVAVVGTVAGSVPFETAVARSVNSGRPLCEVDPGTRAACALVEAVAGLLPDGAAPTIDDDPRPPRWALPWRKRR